MKRHLALALPHRNQIVFDHQAMIVYLALACAEAGIGFILIPDTTNPYSVSQDAMLAKFMELPSRVGADPDDEWQLLVLDDDTAVDVPTIMRMVDSPHLIKGIAYRKKTGTDNRLTAYVLSSRAWPAPDADGYAELDRVGGGCLMMRREAVLRMAAHHPELAYELHGATHLGLWRESYDPGWTSPDYAFCDRARAAGIPVKVLVDAKSTHWGLANWTGNLANDYPTMVEQAKLTGDHEMRNFEVRLESAHANHTERSGTLDEVYSTAFFETFFDAVPEYAMAAKGIRDVVQPNEVLDIGCGPGLMIQALRDHGIDASGFDGSIHARETAPEAVRPYITIGDIASAATPIQRTDCVVCTEVAEHMPESQADALVDCLDRATEHSLVFTAAHPGQPGTDHINCQPPKYWIDKLAAKGLHLDTETTRALRANWAPLKRLWFFPANALVFRREDRASAYVPGVTP